MRVVDHLLQRWRERMGRQWIEHGSRVLDLGCHQGEFMFRLGNRIHESVGLDPLATPAKTPRYELLAQPFREPLPFSEGAFDSVIMLATLEHIRDKEPLARECNRILRPGGRVIITVPSRHVDAIVHGLVRLGLADGMSLDEHHGFNPWEVGDLFVRHGFKVERHRRFQFGLNHLYVFIKPHHDSERDYAYGA